MKKFISIIITITIVLSSFTVGIVANAASDIKVSGDFKYKVVDDSAVITKYIGNAETVDVPAEFDSVPVKEIGRRAFWKKDTVEKVTLPETISTIGDAAFFYCKNLSEVNIPESVRRIEDMAFCGAGITEAVIPEYVSFIDCSVFESCSQLKKLTINAPIIKVPLGLCSHCEKLETVVLPDTVVKVRNCAFYECYSLKRVDFSDKLEEVENEAFADSGLEEFYIGKNVKNIRGLVGAKKLSKLTLDENNEKYTLKDGILYNKKMTKLVFFPSGLNLKKYTIPKTVKSIGHFAVWKNKYLEEVKLNKVKFIYGGNFRYTAIKKIVIPNTVTFIENSFSDNSKLEKVVFKTTKGIGIWDYSFMSCKSLKYGEYPKMKYKYCGDMMFEKCNAVTKIKVLNGVKKIPNFSGKCKALKTIIIPKSVKKITSGLGYNSKKKPVKGFTIKGKKNSAAHKYAKKNGFKFVAI